MQGIIIKGIGGLYFVKTINKIYQCKARGIFRNKNINPQIGDYVSISIEDENLNIANIEEIKERKNFLIRPKVVNIDLVLIIVSVIPIPNLDFLDKLLILIENKSLDLIICINKIDIENQEIKNIINLYENVGYKIIKTSSKNDIGIEDLKFEIKNKISVLAGNSGVGKSSLLNKVNPNFKIKVGELSKKIEKGKHTTTHSELIEVFENTYIVDSPGFSTLDITEIEFEDLDFLFKEFRPFLGQCKFNDCNHINEINCEIKNQIDKNISKIRYERYKYFYKEIKNKKIKY